MQQITCNYLTIQGSSTPSEQAFSSGGITSTAHQNSLSADIFEALQILKSAYHNQHVAMVYQAAEHVDALIAALDKVQMEKNSYIYYASAQNMSYVVLHL
jgi:hypothetical protein